MSRLTRRRLAASIAIVALFALILAQPSRHRPPESGGPVRGMVALINASSPANDVYNAQFCGGVLIGRRQVLTAAHCVETRSAETMDALVDGDNLCRDRPINGLRINVAALQIHPAYDAKSGRFDLAVLSLAVDAPVGSVRAIETPPTEVDGVVAVGWGRGSQAGIPPCRLATTNLRLLSQTMCEQGLDDVDRTFDSHSMLCAIPRYAPADDTCSGDSGGPLISGADPTQGHVIGITSWGRGCGNGVPGVYSRADVWALPLLRTVERIVRSEDSSPPSSTPAP